MNRMRLPMMLLLAMLTASTALAADIPAPETAPPSQPPAEQSKPDVAHSPTDPGLAKQPETIPDPHSVVTPPVVDPKMAINPEAPPPQPAEPQDQRQNQSQPPKKQ
jgi:hypothetical protein